MLLHFLESLHARAHAKTPFDELARNGHLNIVKLLMSFDADINVVNKKGYTALLWATQNEHYEISKKLVESGADINAVIFEGDYAGCLAVTFAYR